jgi:hypothetical protein
MGLSETILAAMIGAVATVTTALFQIFTAFRQKGKVDIRPNSKKGSTMRSILAVLALMVASAAGGFLYSELLKQRNAEDLRAMRTELSELRTLIASGKEVVQRAEAVAAASPDVAASNPVTLPVAMEGADDSVESVAYIPACRSSNPTAACDEQDAQRIALCGTIPAYARVDRIDLFAQPDAMQHPWDQHRVSFEQDLGGARFTGKSFEYAQGAEQKAVCVNFMQWSSEHPHIARVVVQFGFGAPPASVEPAPAAPSPAEEGASVQPPTVIAADSTAPVGAHPAAFAGPASVQ